MTRVSKDRPQGRASHLARLFLSDESAATGIEYGLIAALVSVIIIGGLQVIGTQTSGLFTSVGTQVAAALTTR